MPAIEAYRGDSGTYAGMTVAGLKSQYSPGVQGIVVVVGERERLLRARDRGRQDLVQARPRRTDHDDGLLVAALRSTPRRRPADA